MTNDAVLKALEGGVLTLTLNRPDSKNALGKDILNGLGDAINDAGQDPSVRALVLTNTGNTFCAGADLKANPADKPRFGLVELFELMHSCPKPIVGKINGHCMGGGVGLAAACDISLAADTAKLGFTEVRLGVAPAIISVVCLPKMRRADAMALFLSGERISAQRAVEVGLINQTTKPEMLDHAVADITNTLIMGGPLALAAAKDMVLSVPDEPRQAAFKRMGELSRALFQSDEAREGIAAFRERRSASWVPEDHS